MQGAGNKIGEIYSYKWISEYKWILLSIDILGFIFIILIIWYGTIFSDDLISDQQFGFVVLRLIREYY